MGVVGPGRLEAAGFPPSWAMGVGTLVLRGVEVVRKIAVNRSAEQQTTSDSQPMTAPAPVVSVRAFGLTDKGKVRPTNEDHFLVAELSRTLRIQHTSLPSATTQHGR